MYFKFRKHTADPAIFMVHLITNGFSRCRGGRTRKRSTSKKLASIGCKRIS